MKINNEYNVNLKTQSKSGTGVVFRAVGNNSSKALHLVASALIVAGGTLISKALKKSK